jgi:Acetyltransferase (GNAT) family
MASGASRAVATCALWPHDSEAAHQIDMAVWRARADAAVLVAERADRQGLAGFIEVGTRLYADGCDTSPVAYLEGWYVDRDVRRHCIGAALVRAAECGARIARARFRRAPGRYRFAAGCTSRSASSKSSAQYGIGKDCDAMRRAQGAVTSAEPARFAKPVWPPPQPARKIEPISRWPVRAGSAGPPTHRAATRETARSRRAANRP